jgi:hypothetical protein
MATRSRPSRSQRADPPNADAAEPEAAPGPQTAEPEVPPEAAPESGGAPESGAAPEPQTRRPMTTEELDRLRRVLRRKYH